MLRAARPLVAGATALATALGALAVAAPAGAAGPPAPQAADATQTLVEEAPLAVDDEGAAEPGALDAATDSVAELEEAPPADLAVADAPEAAAADGVVVGLTEPIDIPAGQVSALGVTWAGPADGVHVDLRSRTGDDWTEWVTLEHEAADGEADGEGSARQGTAPYLVTDEAVVQVRVVVTGDARPSDVRLTLVGVGTRPVPLLEDSEVVSSVDAAPATKAPGKRPVQAGPGAAVPEAAVAAGPITAPRPVIHLRSEWAARPFTGTPEITSVQGAVIHHTVTANDYAASQVPAILRSIQAYHMDGRGWSDIGYNFLVDRFGTIWEGRQGGIELPIRGVHASEANSVSTGISVIGRHDVAAVPTATRNAVTRLVAWKLAIHSVPVGATFTLNGVRMTNVIGHRNVPTAQTACPGTYLYNLLPTIRAGAASLQTFLPVPNEHSLTREGAVDVLQTGTPSSILTIDASPVLGGTRIGNGWLPMDLVTIGPALRGGTTRDIVAREQATGRLWIYHGNGKGSFAGKTALGTGWGAMSHVFSPGDFNGDGRRDLIAIERATGYMWFYPGNGALKFGPRSRIGNGWQEVQAASAAGDLTGDGVPDIVGVLTNGQVKVYAGSGRGTFASTTTVGAVTVPVDAAFVPGDVTYDGWADIVLRDASGDQLLTLPSRGRMRFGAPTGWGSGWGGMHRILSGAGWRGSGSRSILAIDGSGYFYEYPVKSTATWARRSAATLDTGSAVLTAVVGDAIGSPLADVVTTDAAGYLYLHEARGDGTFAAPVRIGQGWSGFTALHGIGDLDFDGAPEMLAQFRDGRLFVYPFRPERDGRFYPQYQVGHGFGDYRLVASPDWTLNGGSTVFAINTKTGALRAFYARTGATLVGGDTIGSGWHAFADVVGISNPLSTGRPALLARRASGESYLYLGTGDGGFGVRLAVSPITVPAGEGLR
ncbi:MAG: hypothetical protein GX609_03760 [Actinomycetales bacterium]|nr:hypothetical protein [Actinomycetales bacterium]